MASIEERGNSTRVTWLYGGARGGAKQSCTFNGEPEGRRALAGAAKALVDTRKHVITRTEVYDALLGEKATADPVVPLFKTWAQGWIQMRTAAGDVQADTLAFYQSALNARILPYLGNLRLTEIDKDVLQAWVGWLVSSRTTIGRKVKRESNRKLHPNYIHKVYSVLTGCLGYAVPKWIPVNPALRPRGAADSVRLPPKIPHEGIFLSPAELNLILDKCGPDLRDLVFVAARSGLRLGEILALQMQNVVFPQVGGATIIVRQALKRDGKPGTPKSKASRRAVPVDKSTAEVLRRRCAGLRPSAVVFTRAGCAWNRSSMREFHWYPAVAEAMRCPEHPPIAPPKPKSGPQRRWRKTEVSDCGCEGVLRRRPRFHDLRHTHASSLIDAGWSGKKLQARLGHSDFNVTMNVYGHVLDLGTSEELETLDAFMGGQPAPRPARPVRRHRLARSVRHRRQVRSGV